MLIVGLGNEGGKYKKTYHNIGFMVIDELADRLDVKVKSKECQAVTGVFYGEDGKTILAKPVTMMNLSGEAVYELMKRYEQKNGDLIVVHDDFALPPGQIRIRKDGGAGGHNGIKNVILNVETQYFARFRIGIGGRVGADPMDYVLNKISKEHAEKLEAAVIRTAEALEKLIKGEADIDEIMQAYSK
ncbi:MAG: aminoacyl-tRNA hydrolase [Clostridiaceae bacterium]|jgi:PTH1 family peptidyl-tRNA hydrolase|nr:aminoacyl-tRNA hydrolase [Clostridiaceae bacterium]